MISIDIGTHSIKFLELKTAKKHGLVVKNIDIEYVNSPIGSNFLDDNIKESFNKLITRYKLKNKSINICISDCFLLNKHIENNTGIFDDIEKKINEEADNYFPIAEKERMIVFKPLSNTGIKKELGKAEVYNVLIGAVNKIYILNLLSFLKSNKIKVKSLGAKTELCYMPGASLLPVSFLHLRYQKS
ncbi:pilus assembly protein PilM [Candidatus Desantisbacteria bacterium]|nr:pilus assembly protein PilM [Candidatus Desantisbacteria bacterium]